jgi:adenylate kinase
MKALLLAAPGAGKGTQGERLAQQFGVRHIAAGDLFRAAVSSDSAVGKLAAGYLARGELVPDQVVIDMVVPQVAEAAAAGGYLLDGFPRNVEQASAFADFEERLGIRLDAVIHLEVNEDELIRRLLDRAAKAGRVDDTPDVIETRLRLYQQETAPLIAYYRDRKILLPVDGAQPVEKVTRDISAGLADIVPPAESRGSTAL